MRQLSIQEQEEINDVTLCNKNYKTYGNFQSNIIYEGSGGGSGAGSDKGGSGGGIIWLQANSL